MSAQGYFIEDLSVGQSEEFSKTVTEADLVLYAGVTGDTNPVHLDEEFAAQTMFKTRIAHGMLSAGFISAVLGAKMPGPGAIYVSQELKFKAPVKIGDTVTARCTVAEINTARRRVTLKTECLVKDKVVVDGEAVMMVANRP
ncbi:MAG: MaoC family dehydratase [Alphaproteobacteria bacterium]|nr:MAG: MaoC family dehydratase [Alphaproteobacteria bacterium]